MVRSLLLEGVSPQEYQTMRACLGVHEQNFRPDADSLLLFLSCRLIRLHTLPVLLYNTVQSLM